MTPYKDRYGSSMYLHQTEGRRKVISSSSLIALSLPSTFRGLPQPPHALLSSAWLLELFQYLVWNISCSPTGNKYENSKGAVSMATKISGKVSELFPPTHGTAEIQKA